MKTSAWTLLLLGALAGCAPPPRRSPSPDVSPSSDDRLQEVIDASAREPRRWSPAVTVPLSPLLLVVDTGLKVGQGTVIFLRDLILGRPSAPLPVPDRLDREAESMERK
ncbi:MAG TPA: hypothetical protein VMU54_18955 [Planctomycetota bacterium]|nr:hypothetical protein [Planctomycetota bacterium]